MTPTIEVTSANVTDATALFLDNQFRVLVTRTNQNRLLELFSPGTYFRLAPPVRI